MERKQENSQVETTYSWTTIEWKRKSKGNFKNTLKQKKVEIQLNKTYGMQQKQHKEENLYQ